MLKNLTNQEFWSILSGNTDCYSWRRQICSISFKSEINKSKMDKKVTVLTPNGRRQVVKVTPNTSLLEILEEACQKHNFDCDNYGLLHHNKEVGLTQMFRFSGLPNNCLLEMKELEKKRVSLEVDICVQLEDGTRAQSQFKPSDNVWHVIEKLKGDVVASYKSPVAIYMRKEVIGKENLIGTTLKSLGITAGRAMIRVVDKNPEDLKVQANVYVAPKVKESNTEEELDEKRPRKTQKTDGSRGFAVTKELMQTLKQDPKKVVEPSSKDSVTETDTTKETVAEKPKYDWGSSAGHSMSGAKATWAENDENMNEQTDPEPEINFLGDRKALIYSMDSCQQQVDDLPDSFFDLTVHDLKLVLRDLQKIARGSSEAPLLTEKLRELEQNKTALNKMGRYKNCVIRIQFPDRHVLQCFFKPIETIANVMEFVRLYLEEQNMGFHLFTIPPKQVLPMTETLLELNFVPTALVHFAFDEEEMKSEKFLRSEYLEKLTSIEGAIFAANKYRQLSHHAVNVEQEQQTVQVNSASTDTKSATKGAIPKQRIS